MVKEVNNKTMKLIKPSVEIIQQEPGISGMYKIIELAARVSHKSEDKITEDSAKAFVDKLISMGHLAALEFGTVYLKVNSERGLTYISGKGEDFSIWEIANNPYSRVYYDKDTYFNYITTNLRVLYEHNWMCALDCWCEPTEFHPKRVCTHWVCDRGVSHELVRHRAKVS